MSIAENPGLRERKRLATRKAIQSAVLRLATEKGLEGVTVEEISRRADISPRTFFNYFVSKEAAIVGDGPELIESAELESFIQGGGGDIFDAVGDLMAEAADRASEDRDTLLLRRALHKQHPHLFALRMAGMRQFEDELTAVIARRLAHDDPSLARDQAALTSRARLITLVAIGTLRHAWSCWADEENGESLAKRVRDSFDQLDHLLVAAAAR
ncbi:TetR/AcrR family transcriptional regulator [Galbitalea soli]|uniref:TetR family transcriptional regulator n=1 Tax=Galbitalea soli TaxID=1268042 RepID=A0A7C9TRH5_9MICO|nr:TetR/AcrR family transcriptional regulator [Galbitalea soli]NEM92196.1 TetR family transcriptional regulator [Galbitalea soli]NYJ31850.1 AcrR family transcriptional regulator [Galbitalea soli]